MCAGDDGLDSSAEIYVCELKAGHSKLRVPVGETLSRQKLDGVCIECSECTKDGMNCSEVTTNPDIDSQFGYGAHLGTLYQVSLVI